MLATPTPPLTHRPASPGGRLMPEFTPEAIARFWSKVDRSGGPDACWEWQAGRTDGYGRFWLNGKSVAAHRTAYEIAVGPIPEGILMCHRCDNRPCCNPSHFFLGTCGDNSQDMVAKGRSLVGDKHPIRRDPTRAARGLSNGAYTHPETRPRGENHGIAVLTDAAVRAIRAAAAQGQSFRSIGRAFGVSKTTIAHIVHGRAWTHVDSASCPYSARFRRS